MKTHTKLTEELKSAMRTEYHSVNSKNPVARGLKSISTQGLQNAISQYIFLPRNIVPFLYLARDKARADGWKEVADELTRNMGEELGTETNGVTHYDMLLKGLSEGIDTTLECSLRELQPSLATKVFIEGMEAIMNGSRAPHVLGGTYALESSAVPELGIVRN